MSRKHKFHNTHHVFWPRSEYKNGLEYEFGEYEGFLIPMYKKAHNELHDIVEPPPKPLRSEMVSCLGYLAISEPKGSRDPLWAVERAMQHFVYIGASDPEREPDAKIIRNNLAQQIGIISRGIYGKRTQL